MGVAVSAADARLEALRAWLERRPDTAGACLEPASVDASFRRYFRIRPPAGPTLVAMDAPPEHEDTAAFVDIAARLRGAGLHAPRIVDHEPGAGFVLLEDLGTETYLHGLDAGRAAEPLYADAIDALVTLQANTSTADLPEFDGATLQRELDLFADWYVAGHLGLTPDSAWQAAWRETCQRLIGQLRGQPQVFVHRDFTPRNLMISAPNPGVIDFQDAVRGPITYDWVSLVRDAFVSWPEETEQRWLGAYGDAARAVGLPLPPRHADLRRAVDFAAAQRHLKVIGIFARLCHRDGKPAYLDDVPRFFGYLEREAAPWPELAPLRALLAGLPAAVETP